MNKFWIALGIVFIATVGAKAVVYLYCSGADTVHVQEKQDAAADAGTAVSTTVSTTVSTEAELARCYDSRHTEQLNYIVWRGKHIQQLEACTQSLGEATHALVHRRCRDAD